MIDPPRAVSAPMAEAIRLARSARGRTSPNPPVGAVIVQDGVIVGRGRTQPVGQAHAEIVAMGDAGDAAQGATLYVTLEPCNHTGRTPPCTDAILAAGISEVNVGTRDPHRLASGGIERLSAAGVRVTVGDGAAEAEALIAGFRHWLRTRRPRVTAKFAASLDGKIATRGGDSKWITGEEARARVHENRDAADAIIVGIGTILADDPQLTARPGGGYPADGHQPLRVVVDSSLRIPRDARLFDEPGETRIATSMQEAHGLPIWSFPGPSMLDDYSPNRIHQRVNLSALIEKLGAIGCLDVTIEGGSTLLGAAIDLCLVDRVEAYLAPILLGGGLPVTGGLGPRHIADALRIVDPVVEQLGRDILITGDLAGPTCTERDV